MDGKREEEIKQKIEESTIEFEKDLALLKKKREDRDREILESLKVEFHQVVDIPKLHARVFLKKDGSLRVKKIGDHRTMRCDLDKIQEKVGSKKCVCIIGTERGLCAHFANGEVYMWYKSRTSGRLLATDIDRMFPVTHKSTSIALKSTKGEITLWGLMTCGVLKNKSSDVLRLPKEVDQVMCGGKAYVYVLNGIPYCMEDGTLDQIRSKTWDVDTQGYAVALIPDSPDSISVLSSNGELSAYC